MYRNSRFIVFLTSITSARDFSTILTKSLKDAIVKLEFSPLGTGDSLTLGYIENLVDPIGINEKCRKYGKWLVKFDLGRTIYNTGRQLNGCLEERRVCVGNFSKMSFSSKHNLSRISVARFITRPRQVNGRPRERKREKGILEIFFWKEFFRGTREKEKNDLGKFLVPGNGARGQEWDGRVFFLYI